MRVPTAFEASRCDELCAPRSKTVHGNRPVGYIPLSVSHTRWQAPARHNAGMVDPMWLIYAAIYIVWEYPRQQQKSYLYSAASFKSSRAVSPSHGLEHVASTGLWLVTCCARTKCCSPMILVDAICPRSSAETTDSMRRMAELNARGGPVGAGPLASRCKGGYSMRPVVVLSHVR